MKVQVDRDVLVWLHKQPRNVFLTVLGAMVGPAVGGCAARLMAPGFDEHS